MAMLCPIISVAQNSVTDTLSIKETVFVGFTNQKSVNLTGAVIQVDMNEVLGDRPITSIGAALQGAVPGLSISGKSTPGQFKSVNIRGQLSINGGSPLVLIDNVETDLNMLNPEDIESISVLKDAASAAIYGARAAGGVILITTKRPKGKEKFKLDYSFKLGFNQCLSSPKQASLSQYIDAYEEAGFSSQYWAGGGQVSRWKELLGLYSKGGLAGVYDNGIFKDEDGAVYFLKERDVLGSALEIGVLNSHNIAVSGGTDRVRYRLSGNYSYENGPMVSTKDSYKRYSLNSFISADITGWFTQEASLIYTHENRSDIQTTFRDPYSTKLINWYPEGYMPGEIIGREEDVLIDSPLNACLYSPAATSWTSTPRISLKSILKPLKGWSIIAEYTYQQKNFAYKAYSGQQEIADAQLSTRIIPAAEQDKYTHNTRNNAYNALNIYSNYNLSINGHNLNVTLGYNQESNKDNWILNSVLNQAVITVPSLQGGRGIRTSEETLTEYSTMGFFGRIAYNWKGRYLIEMNARYDGSSKFPKVNRFGFFPSVSGAWRISEEPFMESVRNYINNLKIRASYGAIGNQNISAYGFIAGMEVDQSSVWLENGKPVTSIGTPGLVRANYTWETVKTFDIGLDLKALNNRLSFVFDWYRRSTVGMLSNGVELPGTVGTTAPLQNVADMRTDGWELSIRWQDVIGDFSYHAGFNIYDHRSTITKFNNESNNLKYNYSGKVLGEIWGYVSDGFYSIDDFDAEQARSGIWVLKEGIPSLDGYTPKPGDLKFKDLDPNGTINAGANSLNEPGDRKIIGNSTPRFEYGADFGIAWKGIEFSLILQGVGKRDCILPIQAVFPFGANTKDDYPFSAVYSNQTDYWRAKSYDPSSPDYMVAANPDAKLPRIYGQLENCDSNMRTSDRYLSSGAYLRFKNMTMSYSFPKSLLERTKVINGLRVYLSIENLGTITSLPSGYDPEALKWQYPFYRTYSFGVNLTF